MECGQNGDNVQGHVEAEYSTAIDNVTIHHQLATAHSAKDLDVIVVLVIWNNAAVSSYCSSITASLYDCPL